MIAVDSFLAMNILINEITRKESSWIDKPINYIHCDTIRKSKSWFWNQLYSM